MGQWCQRGQANGVSAGGAACGPRERLRYSRIRAVVPITVPMTDTAATTIPEPDSGHSSRERLGVAAFVVVAVVATASWIALLGWGLVQLIRAV